MSNRAMRLGILIAAVTAVYAAPLAGQATSEAVTVYRREVFDYSRVGRPDPFRSLLDTAGLGVRFQDLSLQGIMYHSDPTRSVAILSQTGSERRIRARTGERVGSMRIVAIGPRTVEVVIEEFGVARRETLELKSVPVKGGPE